MGNRIKTAAVALLSDPAGWYAPSFSKLFGSQNLKKGADEWAVLCSELCSGGFHSLPDISVVPPMAAIGPLQANKKHSFHKWRGKSGGRRCHPERSGAEGRGSEHSAVLGVCAAQSCTSGIDRRSRAELKTSL
jgi:hypothetical protein